MKNKYELHDYLILGTIVALGIVLFASLAYHFVNGECGISAGGLQRIGR